MKVHQLKIYFNVTKEIKRYVYVYIIEAQYLYLIDSGVYGCEQQINSFLEKIGRNEKEIKGIFLTHAHPDHIGSAHYFKKKTGCKVYASEKESYWIEDIDLQFKERPIPNFYTLAGKSTMVDVKVKDKDRIYLEENLIVEVIRSAGHSIDEMSYKINNVLFIGDTVPVRGDIPIIIDEMETRNSLNLLEQMEEIDTYYPAWDRTYSKEEMKQKLVDAHSLLDTLKQVVNDIEDESNIVDKTCMRLNIPNFKNNPLFEKTLMCLRNKSCYFVIDTYLNGEQKEYEEYIEIFKPIVESFGGEYLARSNKIVSLHPNRTPQRVILIRFPSRKALDACFNSQEYLSIKNKREENVEARALIVE